MEPNSTTARPKRTAVANVRFGVPKSAVEITKTSDNAVAASAASTSEDIADATVTKKKKFQQPPSDSSVSDSNTSREGHDVKPSSKPKGKKRPETPPVHLLAHNIAKKPRKVPSMFNPIAARKEQQRKSREEVEEEPHVNESESEKELPEYRRDDDEYYDSESDDSDWSDSDERPPRISIYDSDSEDDEECDEDDDSYFNGLLHQLPSSNDTPAVVQQKLSKKSKTRDKKLSKKLKTRDDATKKSKPKPQSKTKSTTKSKTVHKAKSKKAKHPAKSAKACAPLENDCEELLPLLQPGANNLWKGYHLLPPLGKSSKAWQYYLTYHPKKHPDMKNKNVCRVCGVNIDTSNGVVGLKNHLKLKHRRLYNLMMGIETDSKLNSTQVATKAKSTIVKTKNPDPSTFPQTRMKEHFPIVLSVADRKKQHLGRVTNWIIDTNQFLDARVKNMLMNMMTAAAFARLKRDLLVFMVEQKRQLMVSDLLDGEPPAPTDETEIGDHASNLSDTRDEDDDDLFGGLVDNQDVEEEIQNESDAQLESVCLAELDMYLRDKGMPMHSDTEKKTLNCPLEWWKVNHHKYPVLAILAETFLSIPASSAPSERIWSNAGLVIHYKRAKLAEEAASGIIFLKRNRDVLRKHYEVVTKDAEDALPLRFSGLLDPINEEEVEMLGGINITDVGQDLF